MNGRRLWLLVGLLAFVLGTAVWAFPGLVALSMDEAVLVLVGLLALALAVGQVRKRRGSRIRTVRTPDPERPLPTGTPGEGTDRTIRLLRDGRRVPHQQRTELRSRIEEALVGALSVYRGRPDARRAVEEGSWTEDGAVAAYAAGESPPTDPLGLVRGLVGESRSSRALRRTVDALAAVKEGEGEPVPVGDEPERRPPVRRALDTDENGVAARRRTDRWSGVGALALSGIGLGVLVRSPAVVLAGAVGVGYAAYAAAGSEPPVDLSIERRVSAERPDRDETVTVETTVTNGADRTLFDLRFLDGVPETLAIAEGSPRVGATLRPGESVTVEYTLTAERGVHSFPPATALVRSLSGSVELECVLVAETTLVCTPPLRPTVSPVPLRAGATRFAGQVGTDRSGEGVEFYATREYRPGDPLSRIDWNRKARTGELSTLEFREERAASVVVVVDSRKGSFRAPDPDDESAVSRSIDAAGAMVARLLDDGNRVGLASLHPDPCWLAPSAHRDQRVHAAELLATHPSFDPVPPEGRFLSWRWRRRFLRRLPGDAQLLVCSPLLDDRIVSLLRTLEATGHPVTVVSPDPTTDSSTGERLVRIERALRLTGLREAGVRVIDWPWEEGIDLPLERARTGWRR
ncbi:DUF58 domain-containing protein [Natronorarus salvus]|uniref:DUF58 domain-containing protein n=1 Tax=Natronorarus salvus TaxID=3117733 RepID=UPI002F26022C